MESTDSAIADGAGETVRFGLDLQEVSDLTGLAWRLFEVGREPVGAGAYAWFANQGRGELVYPGESGELAKRLASEIKWSTNADRLGVEAFSRLVARFDAAVFFVLTTDRSAARDLQALIAAANVHRTGFPPIGWGLAWPPTSPRAKDAWQRALDWATGGAA